MHHHEIKVYTVVGSRNSQNFFRFSSLFKEKTLRFLSIAILLIAVPVTVYMSGQTQGTQQHAAGCLGQCVKISSISPSIVSAANLSSNQEVLINGQGFIGQEGMPDPAHQSIVLILKPVVNGHPQSLMSFDALLYVSPDRLKAILPHVLDPGSYDIEVSNPGGDTYILPHTLTITE